MAPPGANKGEQLDFHYDATAADGALYFSVLGSSAATQVIGTSGICTLSGAPLFDRLRASGYARDDKRGA